MAIKRNLHTASPYKIDLHIHSNHSDGKLSIKEIIDFAKQNDLKAISITDHDNTSGLEEAIKYSKKIDIEFITGIELSSRLKHFDLHLLGYGFNPYNANLVEYVEFFKLERIKRAREIVKRLNEIGFNITFESVKKVAGNGSLGRPHIARAMIQDGLANSYQEVFQNYIGEGRKCFVPKYKIHPKEAISLINEAGGVCSLAHPGEELSDTVIFDLIKCGLQGIETIHPRHSQEQVDRFRKIVKENYLIETGGSDCHGKEADDILIGRPAVPYEFAKIIKERTAN